MFTKGDGNDSPEIGPFLHKKQPDPFPPSAQTKKGQPLLQMTPGDGCLISPHLLLPR
jgi:hypothetical protein